MDLLTNDINLIYGERPQFGNRRHITSVKKHNDIMCGLRPVGKLEWAICQSSGGTWHNSNPKFKYVYLKQDADSMVTYFKCPVCNRMSLDVLITMYNPDLTHMQNIQAANENFAEFTHENSLTEFITDDEQNIYVKQIQPEEI